MTRQSLETVGEILDRGGEGKATELRQAASADRGPKAKEAELAEGLPRGHGALVLLEGVVPCLGGPAEVIRGEPGAVRCERPLPPEELLALVEPVEGVLGAVVGGEGELGEARRCLSMTAVSVRLCGTE